MSTNPNIVLNVNGIEVIYNHVILVLKGVSLNVPEGKIAAILGGNGAGKTTTLRAISNLLKAERGEVTKGSVELRGERIEHLTPADLVQRGVVQVMEGRHCFAHLTIEENLLTGAYTRKDGKAAVAATLDKVYADAYKPYASNQISFEEAVTRAETPMRQFMLRQTRGVPPPPETEPAALRSAAHLRHWAQADAILAEARLQQAVSERIQINRQMETSLNTLAQWAGPLQGELRSPNRIMFLRPSSVKNTLTKRLSSGSISR